jgi:hypothetical protein
MKQNVIKLTAAALLLVSFGACKKSSTNSNTPKSKTELLTQKTWKTTNQEFGNGSSWIQNPDWTNAEACERDDLLVLRTNMTYEENEGASKCDPAHPQIIDEGTWAWQENETKVAIDGMVGTIVQLDDNTLQVTTPLSSTTSLRVTYSH